MYPYFPQNIKQTVLYIVVIFIQQNLIAQTSEQQYPLKLYGIFNNPATLETRIAPIFAEDKYQKINATGESFYIPDMKNNIVETEWYGSATLAGDPLSGNLFYADKSSETPALWSVSTGGKHVKLNQAYQALPGHCLTKMAMGPDGYIYAISTGLKSGDQTKTKNALVIRFKPCDKPGCTTVETLGYLSGKNGYLNALTYSGDMAFSAKGDLFLFGTEIDTTINYYKGAHIYKIASGVMQTGKKQGPIPIEYLGHIEGMGVKAGIDSTIITGVAFEPGGSFILSTLDKYTGSRVHFFQGTIGAVYTIVKPVQLKYNIPTGFVISDLASFSLPVVNLPLKKNMAVEMPILQGTTDNWEKNVTITRFND
jgi:hypothetical protein